MRKTNNAEKTKKTSRLLMTAVIVFAIGALLFCGGMFALDWDFSKLDISEYTEKGWINQSGDTITSLELKISGRDVTVNGIDEGEAEITWFDSDSRKVEVRLDGSKLIVKEKYHFVFGPFFNGLNREKNEVIINIPVIFLEKLEVSQSGGDFSINGIETVNKIEYRQSGGSADINGVRQALSVSYDGSGGSLKINNIKANSIAFEQSGGDVYFNYIETESLKSDQSGGLLSLAGLKVEKFDIDMSGGKITGSVNGEEDDYAITVSKSGGSCNIKEKDGAVSEKRIKVKQSGGTINLSFN